MRTRRIAPHPVSMGKTAIPPTLARTQVMIALPESGWGSWSRPKSSAVSTGEPMTVTEPETFDSDAFDADRLREECGVFGIFGHPDAAAITALGLHALQHRGQ